MSSRWTAVLVAALVATSLLAAPTARAATEVGGNCVADAVAKKEEALVSLARAGNPFPLAVTAAGIVTRWKMQVAPGIELTAQKLQVLRPTGRVNEFLVVDESETQLVEAGANEFSARIPVRTGDRFGLTGGFTETLFCDNEGTDTSGVYEGDVFAGQTRLFKEEAGIGTPVTAIVEPDADRDGYGDERQDKCPQSAAFHRDACSAVRLVLRAKARRRSILVRVGADMDVSVQIFGQATWGLRPKPKQGARRPKGNVNLIVGLRGGTKDVVPGKATSFRIALPKTVMRRLGRITPQEALKAEITALATDSDGALAVRRMTVELKGQEGTSP